MITAIIIITSIIYTAPILVLIKYSIEKEKSDRDFLEKLRELV